MLSVLETMVEAIVNFGKMVLWGLETCFNAISYATGVALEVIFTRLPSMPTVPKLNSGLLEEINWFYPFDVVFAALAAGVTMYLGWMGVRFLLRLLRAA